MGLANIMIVGFECILPEMSYEHARWIVGDATKWSKSGDDEAAAWLYCCGG
eukprot:CAMPEP_0172331850 /NCGR_PEP_ID=MMETSP1058-20130122/62139_1 /TAXON_ID=83371 /ORGANISM="Detonula confervacea, Strain CCMP 353" /LENGTH=50 /DNA_ID=CAMNT_0013049123 /DNA_START=652 /DNA_END=801 /DNA_ORIENTATION=-